MIDQLSRFSVVTVAESKKPVIIMENIEIGLLMQVGTPVINLHDLGGEFSHDLILQQKSIFGCFVKITAGFASFSNEVLERHTKSPKEC